MAAAGQIPVAALSTKLAKNHRTSRPAVQSRRAVSTNKKYLRPAVPLSVRLGWQQADSGRLFVLACKPPVGNRASDHSRPSVSNWPTTGTWENCQRGHGQLTPRARLPCRNIRRKAIRGIGVDEDDFRGARLSRGADEKRTDCRRPGDDRDVARAAGREPLQDPRLRERGPLDRDLGREFTRNRRRQNRLEEIPGRGQGNRWKNKRACAHRLVTVLR